MVTGGFEHEQVQMQEICVVVRDQNPLLANGVAKLNRVIGLQVLSLLRGLHIMSRPAQQPNDQRVSGILIQVDSHSPQISRRRRASSSGGTGLGVGWYL
jgi:hypothetical protein